MKLMYNKIQTYIFNHIDRESSKIRRGFPLARIVSKIILNKTDVPTPVQLT